MFKEQNSVCAICKSASPNSRHNQWHVDHNHSTGEIRKLLHRWCNCVVAYFEEDSSRMAALIEYLKKG
jgi:hypothetical protein